VDLADGARGVQGICFARSGAPAAHVDGGHSGLVREDDRHAGAQAAVMSVTDAQTFNIRNQVSRWHAVGLEERR
jgi:hypothetical protein